MVPSDVTDYFKRFWVAMVSLAGILGFYVGAEAIRQVWTFWILVPLGALIALAKPTYALTSDFVGRIRSYPDLSKSVDALTIQLNNAMNDARSAKAAAAEKYDEGISEGEARVMGMLGSLRAPIPELIGIQEFQGSVALVAKYGAESPPARQSRYTVISSTTGSIKGAVRIVHFDEARNFLLLNCIDAVQVKFWDHLAERAAYDDALPVDIQLTRYIHDGTRIVTDQVGSMNVIDVQPEGTP